jgi:hypothetical protein
MNRPEEDTEERRNPEGTTTEPEEVRAVMQQTREALQASGVELERAKRLLRETERLVDRPVLPVSPGTDDDRS